MPAFHADTVKLSALQWQSSSTMKANQLGSNANASCALDACASVQLRRFAMEGMCRIRQYKQREHPTLILNPLNSLLFRTKFLLKRSIFSTHERKMPGALPLKPINLAVKTHKSIEDLCDDNNQSPLSLCDSSDQSPLSQIWKSATLKTMKPSPEYRTPLIAYC